MYEFESSMAIWQNENRDSIGPRPLCLICFYYTKKTKFSSSIHTLFCEDTDMKYLDQFKESMIPRPPDIMLK